MSSSEIDAAVRERLSSGGSLYELDGDLLRQLQPDFIVTQGLCDVCAVSESDVRSVTRSLAVQPEILSLNPNSLSDVLATVEQVGESVGMISQGRAAAAELRRRVEQVRERSRSVGSQPKVVLLEWLDPPFSAGHWNPELIEFAGGRNDLSVAGQPSRQLDWKQIVEYQPDIVIAACCGLDVERVERDLTAVVEEHSLGSLLVVPTVRTYAVDGSQYFNRPGPRLVDSLELLAHLLHPDVHPPPDVLSGAWRQIGYSRPRDEPGEGDR